MGSHDLASSNLIPADRSDPHVVVGPGWDTLRAQTQRGALNAFSMVCSVTEMSVRRK